MNWRILLIVAIAIIAGAAWYLKNAEKLDPVAAISEPPTSTAIQAGSIERVEGPTAQTKAQTIAVPMPISLDGSDQSVKGAVADFAPQLLEWLLPENQIQKWVMLVDQIADGTVPKDYLPLGYTMMPFKATNDGGRLILDTSNYARTNTLIDAVAAIPPSRITPYYHAWYPLLNKAYHELGHSDSFDKRLRAAIDRVLAVKSLIPPATLIRPGVYYQYADPQFERASGVDKLMWRLGPSNTERLQSFLRELDTQL